MKSRIAKISITTATILLMMALVLTTVRPIMSAIQNRLQAFKDTVLTYVEDTTALHISYDTISPNLLGGVRMNGVTISDSLSGADILSVDRIEVSWSLRGIDFSDVNDILSHIKSVTVDGVSLDWDNELQSALVQKLLALTSGNDDESSLEKTESSSSGFNLRLPFGITFRSLSLSYRQQGFNASLNIPQIKLTPKKNGSTVITLNGEAGISFDEKIADLVDSVNLSFKAKGTLTDVLDGSVAQLEVTSSEGDTVRLGTSTLSASLNDNLVEAVFISVKSPYSLTVTYGLDDQQLSVRLAADNFKPISLVTVAESSVPSWMTQVRDLTLTGTYRASANLSDILGSVSYAAEGFVSVPDVVWSGGMRVTLDVTGDSRKLAANRVSVVSREMDIDFSGAFSFAELMPEGELSINSYVLPSGQTVETLFYIDRLPQGFMLFAPQVYAGDTTLTAVQIDCLLHASSVDFSLEASDYSHYENEIPGVVTISGFVSWESGIDVQAAVSLNSFFGDSIVALVNNVLPPDMAPGKSLEEMVAQYIISLDIYATTDLSSVTYNVPYAVVANTDDADQMLLLSLGGNETTISVTQLNLLYDGLNIDANLSADADSSYDQVFFGTSLLVNGMPYSVSGAVMDKQYITFQGDYNLNGSVSLGGTAGISGSLLFDSLPVSLDPYMLYASADAFFEYRSLHDFSLAFNRLAVSETSGTIRIQPSIDMAVNLDQWGMTINRLTFSDTADTVTGNGYLSWTLESDEATGETIVTDGSLGLEAAGINGTDGISLSATFSNPLKAPFSSSMLLSDSYLVAQLNLDHFQAAHLLEGQSSDDTITGSFTLQGALENPSVYVLLPSAHAKIGGSQLSASFEAALEDRIASVFNGSFAYSVFTLDQTDVFFDLTSMQGSLSAIAGMDAFIQATTPLSLDVSLGKDSQSAQLLIERLETNIADPVENYPVSLNRGGGLTTLTAGWTEKVQAVLLDSGEFFASTAGEFPVLFNASGSIGGSDLAIGVSDVSMDLSLLSRMVDYSYFALQEGIVTGSLSITGRTSDPEFGGELHVKDMKFTVSEYLKEPIFSPEVLITAEDNTIYLTSDSFTCGGIPVGVDLGVYFDRWAFDYISIALRMAENTYVAGRVNQAFLDITGDLNANLDLTVASDSMSLTGDVYVIHPECVINNNFMDDGSGDEEGDFFSVYVDVRVFIESKAQAYYPSRNNPIVRGLVTADGPIHVLFDSVAGTYGVVGNLMMRGGEVLYLNRNFYLREGAIYLNESESGFNPLINIRAETRERTNDGKLVRIILSIPNQRVNAISPELSSDSALSELEIRTLLGEAILVESGTSTGAMFSQLAASGVDYLIQNSLIRGLENRLRDSLHFDIFSLRTPFFQQAVESALAGGDNDDSSRIGNFFDNTTVYIGKYIGTSVYMDAMFSIRYDDNRDDLQFSDFVIQPEIGLEFPAPFANIRWSIAPDITQSVQNLWVPYTSLSLSWKLSL